MQNNYAKQGVMNMQQSDMTSELRNLMSGNWDGNNYVPLKEVLKSLEGIAVSKSNTKPAIESEESSLASADSKIESNSSRFVFFAPSSPKMNSDECINYWNDFPDMEAGWAGHTFGRTVMAGIQDYYQLIKQFPDPAFLKEIHACLDGYLLCSEHIVYNSSPTSSIIIRDYGSKKISDSMSNFIVPEKTSIPLAITLQPGAKNDYSLFLKTLLNTDDCNEEISHFLQALGGVSSDKIRINLPWSYSLTRTFSAPVILRKQGGDFVINCDGSYGDYSSFGCSRSGY